MESVACPCLSGRGRAGFLSGWPVMVVMVCGFVMAVQATGVPVEAQEAPRFAKIMPVAVADGTIRRQFFGRVMARQTVELAFQVSGQIIEFPAIEGEPIAKGGLIARLDPEPFQLALDRARVAEAQANRTLDRLEQLQGAAVSQVMVDDAETQAELSAITAREAERSLRHATLVAPFPALVASRSVANYASISAGMPVVRLHDMSDLRIVIDVPEVLFLSAGEDPDFELTAQFPAIDRTFAVALREFNAEASTVGQTFRITLGMSPPAEYTILPGSSVTVTAVLKRSEPQILIPSSAIVTANDGSAEVLVFEPTSGTEGVVRRIPIDITPTTEGAVRVLAGLQDGQEIVASGAALLADGERVQRFTGFAK